MTANQGLGPPYGCGDSHLMVCCKTFTIYFKVEALMVDNRVALWCTNHRESNFVFVLSLLQDGTRTMSFPHNSVTSPAVTYSSFVPFSQGNFPNPDPVHLCLWECISQSVLSLYWYLKSLNENPRAAIGKNYAGTKIYPSSWNAICVNQCEAL